MECTPYKGQRIRESLRTEDREEAFRRGKERAQEILKGREERKQHPLDEYLTQYRAWADSNKGKRTRDGEETAIKAFLTFCPVKSIEEITTEKIDMFLVERSKSRASETVRSTLRNLRAVFSPAVRWERTKENPFLKVPMPQVQIINSYEEDDEERDRILSLEELKKITGEVRKNHRKYYDPIIVLMWTGMRRSELLRLHQSRLNFDKGIIKLSPQRVKVKQPRVIPMLKVVREILLRRTDPFPFQSFTPRPITDHFKAAAESAGIEGVTLKDLRGTFEDNLIMVAGVHPKIAALILGHSEEVARKYYLGMETNSTIKSVIKLDDLTQT